MGTPRTLEVPLTVQGFSLKLDTERCSWTELKDPHWHLWNRGHKIGTITADGTWKEISYDIKRSIREEIEQLTLLYADRIREDYQYNARNGSFSY